ncbi:MAG: hypothetical protein REH79_00875 [Spiroplasma sp.]|nr:hypothetical protein [Spiroplasma sp.]
MRKLLLVIFVLTATSTSTISVVNYYIVKKNNFNKNQLPKKINQFLTETNLGTIVPALAGLAPTPAELRDQLKIINPKLDINHIVITELTTTSALISGDGQVLTGSVVVSFVLAKEIDLISVIANDTFLGNVKTFGQPKPTSEQIIAKLTELKAKYLINLTKITVEVISDSEANIIGDGDTYRGTVTVSFYSVKSLLLKEVITNPKLGVIKTNGLDFVNEKILKKALFENFDILKVDKIDISNITRTSAIVTTNDPNIYVGDPITISFVIDMQIRFDQILINHDLGKINLAPNAQLTVSDIEIALKANGLNSNLNLDYVDITNIQENQATISSIDQKIYLGDPIIVHYQITHSLNLKDLITNPNLGVIKVKPDQELPTQTQIIKALMPYNLDFTYLLLEIKSSTKAIISSTNRDIYTGTVTLEFSLDRSIELSQVLTTVNLGAIDTNGISTITEDLLRTAIINKNPNINLDYLTITNITNATAVVIGDNKHYLGQITVNFQIIKDQINFDLKYHDDAKYLSGALDVPAHYGSTVTLINWTSYANSWDQFTNKFANLTFSDDSIVSLFVNTYVDKKLEGKDLTLQTNKITTDDNKKFFFLDYSYDGGFWGAYLNLEIGVQIWHNEDNIYLKSYWKMETKKCLRNRVYNVNLQNFSFHQ